MWSALRELGLGVYARSVIMYWDTRREVPLEGNPRVVIRRASRKDLPALREIQRNSWGFFIPPDFSRQEVLVALYEGKPAGSVYVNKFTGNLDFGVHVKKEYQRLRIGTALVKAALEVCRSLGFKQMFVVRVFRALTKVNPADKVALSFYRACGARVLREYRGFREKRRAKELDVPDLEEFFET